jgi:hypothetical protein
MGGKRKFHDDKVVGRSMPNAAERARIRASPAPLVKLYEHLNVNQKAAIARMDLGSMLDIKCHNLHNPLINWLAPLYDQYSRDLVIPGRGRIPLNAESVYKTLGLPRGDVPVRYFVDPIVEARIGSILFPGMSSTPRTSQLFDLIKDKVEDDVNFKQMWIMYLVCTILAPTTSINVSNRVYPIMVCLLLHFYSFLFCRVFV